MRLANALSLSAFGQRGLDWDSSAWLHAGSNNRTNAGVATVAANNTRFEGQKLYPVNTRSLTELRFAYLPWRTALSTSAPIVAAANAVTLKLHMVIYDAPMGNVLGEAHVTQGGSRNVAVAPGSDEVPTDGLMPSDFGLSSWPEGVMWTELRGMYDLTVGQSFPVGIGSGRPGGIFSRSGTAATLPDQVDGTGMMTGSSTTYAAMFWPVMQGRFSGPVRSWSLLGDSFTERTWDVHNIVPPWAAAPFGGGGMLARACMINGDHLLVAGVAGYTAQMLALATPILNVAANRGNRATILTGCNDIMGVMPGGVAGQPVTASYMAAHHGTICGALRAGRVSWIMALTIAPRVADNNWKGTDLSQMTPAATSATIAGGAPRNGYGFAPGETRDLWNTHILSQKGVMYDEVYDFGAAVSDTVDTSKFKVDPWSETLASSVAIGATEIVLNGPVPTPFATLILNPGVAGVDAPGGTPGNGLVRFSQSGSGPYTITTAVADPYAGSNAAGTWAVTAKTQTSGTSVRRAISSDGIHILPAEQIAQAAITAPLMAAS